MKQRILFILIFCLGAINLVAQEWEFSVRAGFNVGGTSPLPLPAEIRSIHSYSPTACYLIGGDARRKINDTWGIMTGVHIETKGMETTARVKNYHIRMVAADKGEMEGYFTGIVETTVRNTYFTFPLYATYQLSPRWLLKGGPYFSYSTSREFSGEVYDGYLRDETPIGQKVEITKESPATYDFSDDVSHFQWGAQMGAEWEASSHFRLSGTLSWAFSPLFKSKFDVITFDLYAIYANFGFAYVF